MTVTHYLLSLGHDEMEMAKLMLPNVSKLDLYDGQNVT
jgi:hypothetical protein